MITVHHLEQSRSTRILWLMEELGLDYTVERYARDKGMRAPPELKQVHPLGRAPVVTVDEVVLAESGAILEHFADAHPHLRPTDPEGLREYRFWLHYAEGSVMPPLLVKLILSRIRTAPLPFFLKPIARGIADKVDGTFTDPAIALHFGFIDDSLASRAWFAGEDFTMADIQMLYPVVAGLSRAEGDYPHARRWLDQVEAREAYQKALEIGGPVLPST